MRSLIDFRGKFIGSGARPNLFKVSMAFPIVASSPGAGEIISYLAEASSIPVDKIGEIEIPFMGRKTYYPGDREFDPWTITVMCDENFLVRDAFEKWMSKLNQHEANVRDPLAAVPSGYCSSPRFEQLSKIGGGIGSDESPIKVYQMVDAFPTELGTMEADWGTNNTVHKFQVTFRYQWWNAVGSGGPTTDGAVNLF